MKEQIQLLKIVLDFLDHLSEEQLNLLVSKQARLKLEIENKTKAKLSVADSNEIISINEVCKDIEKFTIREEARKYIINLPLLKKDLKAIAKYYSIPVGSKETNQQIIDKIVENTVGSKLKFDALLNTDLK